MRRIPVLIVANSRGAVTLTSHAREDIVPIVAGILGKRTLCSPENFASLAHDQVSFLGDITLRHPCKATPRRSRALNGPIDI
jgi:hypothetical protein